LNSILENNRESKSLTLSEIEPVFQTITRGYFEDSTHLSAETIQLLLDYILKIVTCFQSLSGGNDAKRMCFITPILIAVCSSFGGQATIQLEEEYIGVNVKARSRCEMVIKKGSHKRVCVVLARKEDMDLGLAQCLLACEILSDVECLSEVCGIVTNYESWRLIRVTEDCVYVEELTLAIQNMVPAEQSLYIITGKLYKMLQDVDESVVDSSNNISG